MVFLMVMNSWQAETAKENQITKVKYISQSKVAEAGQIIATKHQALL